MYRLMYNSDVRYVSNRDGVYYYTRRVPYDVKKHYASDRLSFSLKTKSYANAVRAAQSVTQRLEDYWLGLRLQQMDIPAIHLVKTDDVEYTSLLCWMQWICTFPSRVTMTVSLFVQLDGIVNM